MKIHAFFPVGTLRVSRRAILVKLGSLGSLALGAMILTSQGAPVDYRYPRVPGQLIVGFKAGVADAQEDVIHHTHGDQTLHRVSHLGNARLIQIGGHHNLDQAIREYEAEGLVSYAEPNYLVHAVVVPNDPYFSLQWAWNNTGQNIQGITGVPGADIKATDAWNVTTGTRSVVVGVVDTGIDYNHSDLAANVWLNPGGIGGGPAGSHGFNAITKTYDPLDDNGHGTHVSGTIGAVGNNGVGVAGLNWTTAIMGLKFLDASGSGTTANAISAIDFAVNAKLAGVNLRVLNNSWGGGGYSQALLNEINTAGANDILFVVAAGNSGLNIDQTPEYPASYHTPNMIAVAATDNDDLLASFSNYGATSVHLGAPGVNIASTWPGNSYAWASGTSMATPHVAGAAALILATANLPVATLKSTLLNNVDAIPSLNGLTTTGGRLNVYRAILASGAPPPSPDFTLSATPASRSVTAGGQTTYTVSIGTQNGFAGAVNLSVSGLPSGTIASFNPTPVNGWGSSTLTVSTSSSTTAGTYTLAITGSSGALTHRATVSLTVTSPSTQNFTLSASPASQTVSAGSSTSYHVTVTASGGFASTVNFSVSGLPRHAQASFHPSSVTGSGSSTLTVSTSGRTPSGTYTLTLTGTGGNLQRRTSVSLTVR